MDFFEMRVFLQNKQLLQICKKKSTNLEVSRDIPVCAPVSSSQ